MLNNHVVMAVSSHHHQGYRSLIQLNDESSHKVTSRFRSEIVTSPFVYRQGTQNYILYYKGRHILIQMYS